MDNQDLLERGEYYRRGGNAVPENMARKVWNFLYDVISENPRLPLRLVREAITTTFMWDDDQYGYVPRVSTLLGMPAAGAVAMVRRAVKTGSSTMPRGFVESFNIGDDQQNTTVEKIDNDAPTQFLSENMPDQRGTLKQVIQNGITPFTNMRKSNIILGKSVIPLKKGPLYGVIGQHGGLTLPFAFRFHSDESNKRSSAMLLFRHNKEGRQFAENEVTVKNPLEYILKDLDVISYTLAQLTQTVGSSSISVGISRTGGSGAYTFPTSGGPFVYKNGYLDDGTTEDTGSVWKLTFPQGWRFVGDDPYYPQGVDRHIYGYHNGVKVFPRQYQYDSSGNPLSVRLPESDRYHDFPGSDQKNHLTSPFEDVGTGVPSFYYAGLNRSDLEDISLQLNPMILRRQGDNVGISSNIIQGSASTGQDRGVLPTSDGVVYAGSKGFLNITFGHIAFDGKHSHDNKSLLARVNELDDHVLPRGGDDVNEQGSLSYLGPLGTSFKYDCVIKRGGCRFTCVNRGGSGCNIDIHVFKLKKKHIGVNLDWDTLVKPYTDAYIKRYHEIITADDFKGRDPKPEDIWSNPKFPLLPGSRLVNSEDQFVNRVATHSYYIPSQGRKQVNIAFPGERYDPAAYVKVVDGVDTRPSEDEFTYFCLFSTTGEKSNAMFSSKNSIGTFIRVVSIPASSASHSTSAVQTATIPGFGFYENGIRPSVANQLIYGNPFTFVFAGDNPSTSNAKYNDWCMNTSWNFDFKLFLKYNKHYIDHYEYDVTGWISGPAPLGQDPSYYTYDKWFPVPLPTLQQWLDLHYEDAYDLYGNTWVPNNPVVVRSSLDKEYRAWEKFQRRLTSRSYPNPRNLVGSITYSNGYYVWYEWDFRTFLAIAGTLEFVSSVEYQGYEAPPTVDINIPYHSVRTNFFFFFFFVRFWKLY